MTAMTGTIAAAARPRLIGRLLKAWLAVPTDAAPTEGASSDRHEDLRSALEAASMCQLSAVSAEYAHYLVDRHSGRMGKRG